METLQDNSTIFGCKDAYENRYDITKQRARCHLGVSLTQLAAESRRAPGFIARDGISFLHVQMVDRALEGGASLLAALGRRAVGPLAFDFGGVADQRKPGRALNGVAVIT